jgi:hypothetical protein
LPPCRAAAARSNGQASEIALAQKQAEWEAVEAELRAALEETQHKLEDAQV